MNRNNSNINYLFASSILLSYWTSSCTNGNGLQMVADHHAHASSIALPEQHTTDKLAIDQPTYHTRSTFMRTLLTYLTPVSHLKNRPMVYKSTEDITIYAKQVCNNFTTSGYPIALYNYFHTLKEGSASLLNNEKDTLLNIVNIWEALHHFYEKILPAIRNNDINDPFMTLTQELEQIYAVHTRSVTNIKEVKQQDNLVDVARNNGYTHLYDMPPLEGPLWQDTEYTYYDTIFKHIQQIEHPEALVELTKAAASSIYSTIVQIVCQYDKIGAQAYNHAMYRDKMMFSVYTMLHYLSIIRDAALALQKSWKQKDDINHLLHIDRMQTVANRLMTVSSEMYNVIIELTKITVSEKTANDQFSHCAQEIDAAIATLRNAYPQIDSAISEFESVVQQFNQMSLGHFWKNRARKVIQSLGKYNRKMRNVFNKENSIQQPIDTADTIAKALQEDYQTLQSLLMAFEQVPKVMDRSMQSVKLPYHTYFKDIVPQHSCEEQAFDIIRNYKLIDLFQNSFLGDKC